MKCDIVLNKDALALNIKKALGDFLKLPGKNDLIIIFLSGHGAKDADGDLYFIPHDGILNDPLNTGIELRWLRKTIGNLGPTQKVLVWLDMCHAGAYGESSSTEKGNKPSAGEIVKALYKGQGTAVMASSTGMESSHEDASFGGGHGAFTWAILEGISGKADADSNGVITVFELQEYVSKRVPELTYPKKQTPLIPELKSFMNFPIVKVKE